MKRKNSRKKKGFTLVELIAVIAILGILAAIVVPKVGNFTDNAKEVKNLANAKTIAQAVELYNTDRDTQDPEIDSNTKLTSTTASDVTVEKLLTGTNTKGKVYLDTWPKSLPEGVTTYGDLTNYIKNNDK